ncbi:MAG: hypothetical protein AAF996_11845 [Pseudomonadota bacterium]
MRFLVAWLSFWFVTACASTSENELPHNPSSATAMLVYTPNYGDLHLRRVDLQKRQAERDDHILPAIDGPQAHLVRMKSDPLMTDPKLNQIQAELGWNLQAGVEVIFGQSAIPPGDYAILRYKERASSYDFRMYASMCFREAAPILRVEAGGIYFMDGINTILDQPERGLSGGVMSRKSVLLVNQLLTQKPEIQGEVLPVNISAIAAFEPAGGILDEACAIDTDFSLVGE